MLILGFFLGLIFFKKLIKTSSLIPELENFSTYFQTNHLNFILSHFLTISILITSSLTLIGLILFPIYFLYLGFILSFNISSLTHIFGLNGFIFSLIYLLITKMLYIAIISFIFRKILNIVHLLKKYFFNKEANLSYGLKKNFCLLYFSLFLIFLNDLFIYIFGSKILQKLAFLIK